MADKAAAAALSRDLKATADILERCPSGTTALAVHLSKLPPEEQEIFHRIHRETLQVLEESELVPDRNVRPKKEKAFKVEDLVLKTFHNADSWVINYQRGGDMEDNQFNIGKIKFFPGVSLFVHTSSCTHAHTRSRDHRLSCMETLLKPKVTTRNSRHCQTARVSLPWS